MMSTPAFSKSARLRATIPDSHRVGGLEFDWNKETLFWTCEEPVDYAVVQGSRSPLELILTAIKPYDVELLASFDAVPPSQLGRQHDLTFQRNPRFHALQDGVG